MFQHFQKFFDKAAQNYGVTRQIEAAKICHDFRKMIPDLFNNEEAVNYIDACSYKEMELIINVENSAWAQEVVMKKTKIINDLNEKAGKKIINKLKTRIKPLKETLLLPKKQDY